MHKNKIFKGGTGGIYMGIGDYPYNPDNTATSEIEGINWGGILLVFIFMVGFILSVLYPSSTNFKTSAVNINTGKAEPVVSLIIFVCSLIIFLVLVGQNINTQRQPAYKPGIHVTTPGGVTGYMHVPFSTILEVIRGNLKK